MASEIKRVKAVQESMRKLKLDAQPKEKIGDMSGPKEGSTSDVTSCISYGDVTSMFKEGEVDRESVMPDQGVYNPWNGAYGYYYPGSDGSFGEWENQSFLVPNNGLQIQHTGNQVDNGSPVYYFPGFQPGYNPQTQYIPGPLICPDGQYWGQQIYYPDTTVPQRLASPGFFPPSIPYGTELYHAYAWNSYTTYADGLCDPAYGNLAVSAPKPVSARSKTLAPSKNVPAPRSTILDKQGISTVLGAAPNPTNHIHFLKPMSKSNTVVPKGSLPMNKLHSYSNQGENGYLYPNSPSSSKETTRSWVGVEKLKANNRAYGGGDLDMLNEQNRGPRTNAAKNSLASGTDSLGFLVADGSDNCCSSVTVVKKDEYNLDVFSTKYDKAFFFVIKSYSEDDVHKSIKYNVWASTPNGNKRLDAAFLSAQEKMAEMGSKCPVFLFFSVNASGQFCGVAEMIGRVDFNKNMDFWQQDKWNGYFPVKWHIIKDIPNLQFRHIILENNDNKPVTNSRDTQEVKLLQGIEMLNLFKSYSSKTSILDDFEFYENRQKIMQEKKTFTPKLEELLPKTDEAVEAVQEAPVENPA